MGGNIGLPILAQDPLPEGGVYVLELSSYQIDLTQSLDCDVAVLLNITPDHLDRYESFEAYAASKARLFEMQSRPTCIASSYWRRDRFTRACVLEHPTLTESLRVTMSRSSAQQTGQRFKVRTISQNAHAALAAVEALSIGVKPTTDSRRGLRTYPGLPHRMERIREKDGVTLRQRQQGDQPDRDRAGARRVRAHPLDLRRAGQDRQSRRMRAALRPCPQGLYHRRGGRIVRFALVAAHGRGKVRNAGARGGSSRGGGGSG